MELVGRWWNRKWERVARRDIWLTSDGRRWSVRARHGGDGGDEVAYEFDRDYQARAMVDRLKAAAPGEWKDLTKLMAREQRPGPAKPS